MCSREVNLTEEEKEILKAEGLPIPTTLPLTKVCNKQNIHVHVVENADYSDRRKGTKECPP